MTKRSTQELKAMAYSLADEIETVAQKYLRAGMRRDRAVMLAVAEIHNKIIVVKG